MIYGRVAQLKGDGLNPSGSRENPAYLRKISGVSVEELWL